MSSDSPAPKAKKSVALSGVIAGNTAVCTVGRTGNDLHYRGYDIQELAMHATFEEVSHLLIHDELPTQSELKDYKKNADLLKEVDKALKDRYYSSMDYKLQDKGKEKVGGMDAMKFFMTYSDSTFGEIDVTVHAIDTGKGITLVIFDGIRKEAEPYQEAIAGILASIKFYDEKAAPVADDTSIDVNKLSGKYYQVKASRLKIWIPNDFDVYSEQSGSTQYDYQFYTGSRDGAVILKIYTYQDDYLNIQSLDSKTVLIDFLKNAGFDTLVVKGAKTAKFNGKDSLIIDFTYMVDQNLTAVCRAVAIDTDNGISVYVEDILQPDLKKYKDVMGKISGSVEVIRVLYDGTQHPWAK